MKFVALILAGVALTSPVYADELTDAGAKVFKKCMACHVVDKKLNKVGPSLNGVVGRKAGTVEGFKYSDALVAYGAAGAVWDEANIDRYLADPKGYIPKNKMAFAGVKSEDERKAVIAYLKSVPPAL